MCEKSFKLSLSGLVKKARFLFQRKPNKKFLSEEQEAIRTSFNKS